MARLRVVHLRFLVPFLVLAWRAGQPIGDNSFLWHVGAGRLQMDAGEVLRSDPFSFTIFGEAWRTQSWLADLGYAWLDDVTGGLSWVPLMKFIVLGAVVALLGLVTYKVSGRRAWVALSAMLLATWQAVPFSIARPALLGFVLLAVVVAITNTERRALWALPLIFWLWASLHGLFVVGLGYLVLDAVRRRSRRQFAAAALGGLATALTAHGIGTWWILLQFSRNREALDLIREWESPDLFSVAAMPLLVVILGLMAAGATGRLHPRDLWVIVPFVAFGVMAGRNVFPAVIVLIPLLCNYPDVKPRKEAAPEPVVVNYALAAVLIVVMAIGVGWGTDFSETRFPAPQALDALAPGKQWNDSVTGGYMVYAYPERPVYIDDRAELYGAERIKQFQDTRAGVGVEEAMSEFDLEQAIVPVEWPMVGYLDLLGWEREYEDEFFVVMTAP